MTQQPDRDATDAEAVERAESTAASDGQSAESSEAQGAGATDRQSRRDARWRERAVSAETRVDRLVRREVTRLLAEHLVDPATALSLADADVTGFLGEDDEVNPEHVRAFAAEVVAARPYLARTVVHHADLGPKRTVPQRSSASWSGLITGR